MQQQEAKQSNEEKKDIDDESLSLSKVHDIYQYNRTVHVNLTDLMSTMCHRYGWSYKSMNRKCLITSSGMAAISTVLHNILIETKFSTETNLIYANEIYDDVPTLIKYLKKIYCNFNIHTMDITDNKSIINLFNMNDIKNKINILYFETCSNPSGFILDYSIIPKLQSLSKYLYIVADNTWLTSAIFNPFDVIISDNNNNRTTTLIVVTSLSKYYSGGSCIGGAILSDNMEFIETMEIWIAIHGHHVSPYHCKLILDNIKSMDKRIAKTSKITMDVTRFIKQYNDNDDIILDVKYPLLDDHISYEIAKKYWKNKEYGPSVLLFKIKLNINNEDDVWKWMKKGCINNNNDNGGHKIEIKTSFGGIDTRFDSWPKITNDGVYIRLAIGYNDNTQDIISTLKQMFRNTNNNEHISSDTK